jgi:hypothetical protein
MDWRRKQTPYAITDIFSATTTNPTDTQKTTQQNDTAKAEASKTESNTSGSLNLILSYYSIFTPTSKTYGW